MLAGRPFGGIMLLINSDLRRSTEFICSADHYAIVRVADCIIIDVYLPCKGTENRQLICQDVLDDVWSYRERFMHCKCLIGGDFNVDLSSNDGTANIINSFFTRHGLTSSDKSLIRKPTYVNESLNHESIIDYIFTSDDNCVSGYEVIDLDINFSDHLPIKVACAMDVNCFNNHHSERIAAVSNNDDVIQLRWDHADVVSYYHDTGTNLQPVMADIDHLLYNNNATVDVQLCIDIIYYKIVKVLRDGANMFVPAKKKSFLKFWEKV